MKMAAPSTAIYQCPVCKNNLVAKPESLFCETCKVSYTVESKIPDFISAEGGNNSKGLVTWANSNYNLQARIYEFSRYPWRYYLYGGLNAPDSHKINNMIKDMISFDDGLILDVACGPGTLGRPISSNKRCIYGIDISKAMLQQGVFYTKNNPNMHFARALVENLPFSDARFDAALCGSALHFFNNPLIALQEIARTLKTGAPLVVIALLNSKRNVLRRFRNWLFHPQGTHLFTVPELDETLREAGFADFRPTVYGSMVYFTARKK